MVLPKKTPKKKQKTSKSQRSQTALGSKVYQKNLQKLVKFWSLEKINPKKRKEKIPKIYSFGEFGKDEIDYSQTIKKPLAQLLGRNLGADRAPFGRTVSWFSCG